MKKVLIILLTCFATNNIAKQVPLINFAEKSQIKTALISPDAKNIAYTYEDGNEVKLAVIDWKSKKGLLSLDVGPNREIVRFWWANNKRIIVLGGKITGWLDGSKKRYVLIAVDVDGKKKETLWDFQRSDLWLISVLRSDPKHVLVLKRHFADHGNVNLHRLNFNTGKMHFVSDSPRPKGGKGAIIRSIAVDLKGIARFAVEHDPQKKYNFDDNIVRLHVKNSQNKWEVLKLANIKKGTPIVDGIGVNSGNDVVYFISDYDLENNGTLGLFSYDINSKKITKLFRHPEVDISHGIHGANGALIGVAFDAGYRGYYYVVDKKAQNEIKLHKSIRASFENQNISFINYSQDEKFAVLHVYSDKNPGDFYIFDRVKNKATFLASSRPSIDPKNMAVVEPFTLITRDGLKVYGQLTLPPDKELKNLPMVVYPHGGPYGVRDRWGWDSRAQLLANRGYLVLQLDFRGSGGYGEKFKLAGYHQWGAKMQDDITDATLWAIKQNYADKNRVCIHGVSYGGYAAMQAVVREPDLYKCSIPDAGIYDIELQWKKADSFKGGRTKAREHYLKRQLGENWKELMSVRSPAHNVDKIKAKLLLVHGKQDIRVPIENSYMLGKKLKKAGISYETLYKDDGHGFQKVDNRIELYKTLLKFLDKQIGN